MGTTEFDWPQEAQNSQNGMGQTLNTAPKVNSGRPELETGLSVCNLDLRGNAEFHLPQEAQNSQNGIEQTPNKTPEVKAVRFKRETGLSVWNLDGVDSDGEGSDSWVAGGRVPVPTARGDDHRRATAWSRLFEPILNLQAGYAVKVPAVAGDKC